MVTRSADDQIFKRLRAAVIEIFRRPREQVAVAPTLPMPTPSLERRYAFPSFTELARTHARVLRCCV